MPGSCASPAAGASPTGNSPSVGRTTAAGIAFAILLPLVPAAGMFAGAATLCAASYIVASEPSIDAEDDLTLALMLVASLIAAVATGFVSLALWFVAPEVWYAFSIRPAGRPSADARS